VKGDQLLVVAAAGKMAVDVFAIGADRRAFRPAKQERQRRFEGHPPIDVFGQIERAEMIVSS
jgi:hypothetical protein